MMKNPFKRATPAFEAQSSSPERSVPASDLIAEASEQIDATYDAQLYDGMPIEEAMRVERSRDAAHRDLMNKIIGAAAHGRNKLHG